MGPAIRKRPRRELTKPCPERFCQFWQCLFGSISDKSGFPQLRGWSTLADRHGRATANAELNRLIKELPQFHAPGLGALSIEHRATEFDQHDLRRHAQPNGQDTGPEPA